MRLAFASAGLVRRDLWRSLPPRMDLVLRHRLAAGLTRHPNATNPWAWRLLLGRECPDAPAETPVRGIQLGARRRRGAPAVGAARLV